MSEMTSFILQRIHSKQLSKLRGFYRDYFISDADCLQFIYDALHFDPADNDTSCDKYLEGFNKTEGKVGPEDTVYIPRRMMNCVERLVSTARDMEQIRRGEDIFKLVYLVVCVETLQKLSGKYCGKKCGKRELLFDFFENYTSAEDKAFVSERFTRGSLGLYPDEETFFQFINALNEHRNFAVHDGEFYDFFFNNDDEQMPLSVFVKFDFSKMPSKLKKILAKSEGLEGLEETDEYKEFLKRLENDPTIVYETTLSYRDFEKIFVRTCIEFISRYVAAQEEKINADA